MYDLLFYGVFCFWLRGTFFNTTIRVNTAATIVLRVYLLLFYAKISVNTAATIVVRVYLLWFYTEISTIVFRVYLVFFLGLRELKRASRWPRIPDE